MSKVEYLDSVVESFLLKKARGLLGAVEDLFEDGTDGDVACVGGQDEGKTRRREAEVGGVGECLLCFVEGGSMRRHPGEGLGLSSEGSVERGLGSSNVKQESMVVVNHANKLLKGLHGGGCWEGTNGGNFFL